MFLVKKIRASFLALICFFLLMISFLATSPSALATYPFYFFDEDKLTLTDNSFEKFVLPQLKIIISEYYYILGKIGPEIADVIIIKDNILDLKILWQDFHGQCSTINDECENIIKKIYKKALTIDQLILAFKSKSLTISNYSGNNNLIDNWLKVVGLINEVAGINYQQLHTLEEILIFSSQENISFEQQYSALTEIAQRMLVLSEIIITSSLDKKYRFFFEELQLNMIKDIEYLCTLNLQQNFFIKKMGDFNFFWNSFNMKMSKGTVLLPGNTGITLTVIQNRWNSILRLYLKNTAFVSPKDFPKATVSHRADLDDNVVFPEVVIKTEGDSTGNSAPVSAESPAMPSVVPATSDPIPAVPMAQPTAIP